MACVVRSGSDMRKCVVSADTIRKGKYPQLLARSERPVEIDNFQEPEDWSAQPRRRPLNT